MHRAKCRPVISLAVEQKKNRKDRKPRSIAEEQVESLKLKVAGGASGGMRIESAVPGLCRRSKLVGQIRV